MPIRTNYSILSLTIPMVYVTTFVILCTYFCNSWYLFYLQALAVAYNADGSLFASGSFDRTVILYDGKTYKKKQVFSGHKKKVYIL